MKTLFSQWRLCLVAAVATPLATLTAHAAEPGSTLSTGSAILRAGLGLAFVLALIYVCAWIARRFGVAKHLKGNVPMKIVGTLALSPRERIITLEVDGTWLVVGVTQGGMQTLYTLPAQTLSAPPPPSFLKGFEHALQKRLRGETSTGQNPRSS